MVQSLRCTNKTNPCYLHYLISCAILRLQLVFFYHFNYLLYNVNLMVSLSKLWCLFPPPVTQETSCFEFATWHDVNIACSVNDTPYHTTSSDGLRNQSTIADLPKRDWKSKQKSKTKGFRDVGYTTKKKGGRGLTDGVLNCFNSTAVTQKNHQECGLEHRAFQRLSRKLSCSHAKRQKASLQGC